MSTENAHLRSQKFHKFGRKKKICKILVQELYVNNLIIRFDPLPVGDGWQSRRLTVIGCILFALYCLLHTLIVLCKEKFLNGGYLARLFLLCGMLYELEMNKLGALMLQYSASDKYSGRWLYWPACFAFSARLLSAEDVQIRTKNKTKDRDQKKEKERKK